MFSDETLVRARAYEKAPVKFFPDALEALSSVHISYMVDSDILDNINLEFYHGKDGFPYFCVRYRLKSDVQTELITLQHSKLF